MISSAIGWPRTSARVQPNNSPERSFHSLIVPSARVRVSKGGDGRVANSGDKELSSGGDGKMGNANDPAPVKPLPSTETAPIEGALNLPIELLQKLRETIRNTENVGRRFPEEARKIHYNETPARSIRGQASRDEAEELSEEGIDFTPLPPFLTSDSH